MMLTLLRAAGFRLRGADPVAMKAFVLAVHARAAQAAAAGEMTPRAEVVLSYRPVGSLCSPSPLWTLPTGHRPPTARASDGSIIGGMSLFWWSAVWLPSEDSTLAGRTRLG